MKKEKKNYGSSKYVTHEQLDKKLSNFVTKKEFNEFKFEVNIRFDKLENRMDKLETSVHRLTKVILSLKDGLNHLIKTP